MVNLIKQDRWWKRLWAPAVCYLIWLVAVNTLPESPILLVALAALGTGAIFYVFAWVPFEETD